MTVRQALRRFLPYEWRLRARLLRRSLSDARGRYRFAQAAGEPAAYRVQLCAYERPFIDYPGQEALREAKRRNQAILASKLDGVVVRPGETLSVWRLAGRPTARHGYAPAAALKNGQLTTDVGGAICLLSTVLYNVALLGGMRVVERHCHSVDSYGERRYFELGRDAAIEFGYRDLRFTNPHPVAVILRMEVDGERVHGSLWAHRALGFLTSLEVSEPVYSAADPLIDDPTLNVGVERVESPGLPGIRVLTTRVAVAPDGTEHREVVGESIHAPQAAVIRRGTG